MSRVLRSVCCPLVFFAALWSGTCFAQELRAIPDLSSSVIDEAQALNWNQRKNLESVVESYFPAVQFQVWIVPNLQGEAIESLSIRAVDKWKLGQKGKDNGVLLLLALEDRKMRLEVGRGLEGDLTDIFTSQVLRGALRPALREGNLVGGIQDTLRILYKKATGESLAGEQSFQQNSRLKKGSRGDFLVFALIVLLVIFSILGRFFGGPGSGFGGSRGRGVRYGGGGYGGGGWGGGGGSWSGGGGGFSGGGSSGSW